MTIKYRDKNVSAENKNWILTTPVTLDSNGILTIAKENFYNDETGEVTLNLFDLGVQLIVLEDDNEKTALQKLNEKAQSNDPNIVKERKSHGYLIEHPDSTEQDKWYSEYFWIESKQKFEALGSTKADLNPLKNEINELKNRATVLESRATNLEGKTTSLEGRATDLEDRATNLENNKVDKISGKGLSTNDYTNEEKQKLQSILTKLGFDKQDSSKFNFAVISDGNNKEYWILSNARYDYDVSRFIKLNPNYTSFGIQIQAEGTYPGEEDIDNSNVGINFWRNPKSSEYYQDISVYDYTDVNDNNYIGAKRLSNNEWINFGISSGWNNMFMLDSYGGMTIGGAGLEIDGNGIFPFTRLTHSTYKDENNNIYYLVGILDNAYHPTQGGWQMDNNNQPAWFFGFKTPEQSYLLKDNQNTSFVIMYNDTPYNSQKSHELDVSKWHIVFEIDKDTVPYLKPTDIVNDLSTGGSSSALSAEQGKLLRLMNGDPMVLEVQGNSLKEYNNLTALQGDNIVIDYGDGIIESLGTKLRHNYTDGKSNHTIKIYNVTNIGMACFANCSYLTSVSIPNSVTSFGSNCFGNCTRLTSITLPSSISSLGATFLFGCTSLTSINIPSSVSSLGDDCLSNCTGLTSINIPSSVSSLGNYCLSNCTGLTDYYLNWINPPITWSNDMMPNNTNTIFHIPYGTIDNYVAKGFPLNKLREYIKTSEETTDSITDNDLRPVTSNAVNDALSTKASTATASSSTNGLMSSTDKSKLDDMTTVALEVTYADGSPSETLYLVKRSGGS